MVLVNNQVRLMGHCDGNFRFSHEVYGEKFYTIYLNSERESGTLDRIPVIVSERLWDTSQDMDGRYFLVWGNYRSHNKREDGVHHTRLILEVFAHEFEEIEEMPFREDDNAVILDGYICKPPVYRETPLNREISDILLAVNRSYGKSDYIPCIAWGRNARYASRLNVGDRINVEGRIQSRKYQKYVDGVQEERTAYEVSIYRMSVVEEKQE